MSQRASGQSREEFLRYATLRCQCESTFILTIFQRVSMRLAFPLPEDRTLADLRAVEDQKTVESTRNLRVSIRQLDQQRRKKGKYLRVQDYNPHSKTSILSIENI